MGVKPRLTKVCGMIVLLGNIKKLQFLKLYDNSPRALFISFYYFAVQVIYLLVEASGKCPPDGYTFMNGRYYKVTVSYHNFLVCNPIFTFV